jgi:Predicted nucleotidyltransferases
MITITDWMPKVLGLLQNKFGARLACLGLQGSYRRGEANESSDIDLVALFDTIGLDDLDAYRDIVRTMPEGEKACGFICGLEEMHNWPRHEVFAFSMDTDDYYGKLAEFLPPITRADIEENVTIGASGLYHLLNHSYLYANPDEWENILAGTYKGAYFVMQVSWYLRTGEYHRSKRELLAHVNGIDKEILTASMDFPVWLAANSPHHSFSLLLSWCRNILLKS